MSTEHKPKHITEWVLVAVLAGVILVFLWFIRGILLLTLASIVLVVLFTMPTRFLVRLGMGRTLATFLSMVWIILLIVLLVLVALPTLVLEFTTLASVTIPAGVRELIVQWNSGDLQRQYPFLQDVNLQELFDSVTAQLAGSVGSLGASVLPFIGGVANTILSILIVIFLSMYFLADPDMHQEGLVMLFPLWYRQRVREIVVRLDTALRGWLRVTIVSMGFVGFATGFGLALLGIEQHVALGVLAGVSSFIPNFGPIVALIPSVTVGVVQAPENVLWIVVLIYGVSLVQSQVLSPLLVAESIKIPAVLVLLGQIIGGALFGFLGIMLAVPLMAIIIVLIQEIYIKDVLGDRSADQVENEPLNVDDMLLRDGL